MIYVFCATATKRGHGQRIIKNLLDTSQSKIVMIVGLNKNYLDELTNFKNSLSEEEQSRIQIFFEPYSPSFSYAINAGWARIRHNIGNDKNILASATADDMEFKEGWYDTALKHYNKHFLEKDGLMFLNDLRARTNIGRNGLCVVSAKFSDIYMAGWLVSPYYHVSGIDIEYAGVADKFGKRAFCKEAKVFHLLADWSKTEHSEQRKMGLFLINDRPKRGYIYDIVAPWRHWK